MGGVTHTDSAPLLGGAGQPFLPLFCRGNQGGAAQPSIRAAIRAMAC